jgi:hypothetical protein
MTMTVIIDSPNGGQAAPVSRRGTCPATLGKCVADYPVVGHC